MSDQTVLQDARTVVQLADYFDDLKAAVARMRAEGLTRHKDYFTPGEEERLRALQVSYWKSRDALLEIVRAVDPAVLDHDQVDVPRYLVSLASAVLLVDAARYLRETFHRSRPVRHKLDEPDPELGVPAGMYSLVQESLTRPAHAWRLYQAMRFFADNDAPLRAAAAEAHLADVLAIVDRLGHRARPTLWGAVGLRLRVRGRMVAAGVGREGVGRAVYELQRLVSSLLADRYLKPGHHPHVPDEIRRQIAALLAPGDVLVVRKEFAVTNYFLPGYWPHAALYLGGPRRTPAPSPAAAEDERARGRREDLAVRLAEQGDCVLEALKDGVRVRSLDSPLASDSVLVLRPQLASRQIAQALDRALAHEGKPYDFDFDFSRSDQLVCTEVIYRAYDGIGGICFPLKKRAGRNTLAACELVEMALVGQCFHSVAAFVPRLGRELSTGEAAVGMVKTALAGRQ